MDIFNKLNIHPRDIPYLTKDQFRACPIKISETIQNSESFITEIASDSENSNTKNKDINQDEESYILATSEIDWRDNLETFSLTTC
jgi:hypothetical protein